MSISRRTLLLALLAASGALAWQNLILATDEIAVLSTMGTGHTEHYASVWYVEANHALWIRAENREQPWLPDLLANPRIELAILTGLTLARPAPSSELERRLVGPITEKAFGNAPEPAWIAPLRAGRLPPNVRVQEFFLEPGAWLHSPLVQQSYASINYTHVARSVLAEGANVIAQQVALRPGGRVSLGTNPDVTADLIPMLRERERAGTPVAVIGQANDRMPFMFGAAEQPAAAFDFLVDDPAGYHDLVAPPNLPIPTAEHAIALGASMLIRDGGTIQIGIGEDDGGVLPAQFHRGADQVPPCLLGDDASNRARPGEHHIVNGVDESWAANLAPSGHDLDHALRHTGFVE